MKSERLSKAELRVLATLWSRGPSTVAQVRSALTDDKTEKPFAYTTVATHLTRIEEKGAARSHKVGRARVYEATEDRIEFSNVSLNTIVKQLFDGSAVSLASQFIETNSFSTEELSKLKRLIDEKSSE